MKPTIYIQKAPELAEKFNINLDFISEENCTVHDEHTEFPSSECDFYAKDDTTRFYGSESTILISDIEKKHKFINFSTLNHITSFSVGDYCDEVMYMNKIRLNYPENIKNIKVKKENSNIYIEESEENEIGEWLKDYINSHQELFPFDANGFQIEHNVSFGVLYHTNAIFYENGTASATDVLLGYYDFLDNINAAYITGNTDGEKIAEISFSVSKPTFTKEKIGDYELISYEEAKEIFEDNENINYSSDANSETIKNYELRLAYVLDNDSYARPIYVKQENYGWFNEKTGWIDAIK